MKSIDRPLNSELLEILNNFSDWFFQQDMNKVYVRGTPDENEYYTSKEYLDSIDRKAHIGYPEKTYGVDLMRPEHTDISIRPMIVKTNNDLNAYLGAKFCAVNMYYPMGGYMGWHNNHNCPGYNILLSYNSEKYGGFFRYQEPQSSNIITLYDNHGWFAKVGYYGHNGEPDKLYWHCARAFVPRLTFGYVIPDESMWQMMVDAL